jgi:hypothetical protein
VVSPQEGAEQVINPENALISRTMRPHGEDEAMITEVWDRSHPDSPYVSVSRPRVRVKAPTRVIGCGVPDDAQPGDIVIGNRGAAAEVRLANGVLYLAVHHPWLKDGRRKIYDFSGGTIP